ncbi:unnamed protein product [Phytophthora fragariaefolia]|uniref:Unnamed protein product n=1 Tax=Phytophthora fragariaefolia TaxID=1490495 RepID=A0A9W7CR35_9STRA|nr:unnamed protein product [Phytophthora fragariaefolia]
MYYNQRVVRQHAAFRPGQLVWIYRPAREPGITKFGHRWRGPGQVVEAAGYANYLGKMLEAGRELITHCSFQLNDDENSSEMAGQTEECAAAVTNNLAAEAFDVTPVDSTAMETEPRGEFGATPTIDNQRSSAQTVTHLTFQTVAAKRPRGRPRKCATDTVVEREVDIATGVAARASAATTAYATAGVSTPASTDIRTAADEETDIAADQGLRHRANERRNEGEPDEQPQRLTRLSPDAPVHGYGVSLESESSEDGRTHERLDPNLQHSTASVQADAGASDASQQASPQQPEQQPSAETEEDECVRRRAPTALSGPDHDCHASHWPQPWWSVDGESTERMLGITQWSLKLNTWVINLAKLTTVTHHEKRSVGNEVNYVDIIDHDSETSCPQISLADYVERRMANLSVDDGEDNSEDSSESSGEYNSEDGSENGGENNSEDSGSDSGLDNGEDGEDGRADNDQDDGKTKSEDG